MVLLLLVTVSIAAALLAKLAPRWDAPLAWVVGTVLAACAGLFAHGFDHDEYLNIIDVTRQLSDEGIAVRLVFAKDPIFLFIIDMTSVLTDKVQPVFMIVACMSVFTKVLATSAMPNQRTMFMALYAVFLAPGLEFAAIRTGLAVGLIMLGYLAARRVRWKALWVSLGLASHLSMLFVVAGRAWPRWRRPMVLGLLVLVPIVTPTALAFIGDDPRYFHYLDDRGTPLAFFLPGATLLSMLMLSRSMKGRLPRQHLLLTKDGLTASYFVVMMSLLLTVPVVTAATRVMELAWVFILMQLIARDQLMVGRLKVFQAASWCTMIAVLSISNILRGTWAVLL